MTTEQGTLAAVIVGFLYQAWREWRKEKMQQRQRDWDLADRATLAHKLELDSQALAVKFADTKKVTLAAIAENTEHTIEAKREAQRAFVKGEEAWTEANNLTNKFIDVVKATKGSDIVGV